MPYINNLKLGLLFLLFFAIFLIAAIIMRKLSKGFYTIIPAGRTFSIFNLEFPGSDEALTSLVLRMNNDVKMKVRKHLIVDYLFMLGAYPAIAILCFITSNYLSADSKSGSSILIIMGVAQVIPWLFDIIQNWILLQKLKKPIQPMPGTYRFFKYIVGIKLFITLTAINSALFINIYLWLIGGFSVKTILIFSGLGAAFILFMLVKAAVNHYKRKKEEQLTLAIARSMLPNINVTSNAQQEISGKKPG